MKKRLLFTVIPIVFFFITDCALFGLPKTITESRDVSNFNRVSLSGSGKLIIVQGDEESLTVEADEDFMPYVKTEVKYGTLFLGLKNMGWTKGMWHSNPIRYNLSLKDLNALDLSGSGDIKASKIKTDKLDIHISGSGNTAIESLKADELVVGISGSGNCELAGNISRQEVKISGSGDYHAPNLDSRTVLIKVSGSGKATVWTRDELDVRISGSGKVNYYGNPNIHQTISGSGKANSIGDHVR